MQEARNSINILTIHVIVAHGMTPGMASEVALAIKAQKRVILLGQDNISITFFMQLSNHSILVAQNPQQAIDLVKTSF